MLASLLGIRLILLMGKTVPLPAPASVMNALKEIKVTNDAKGKDGFEMTLTLAKEKAADYGLLVSGVLDPDTRVVIGALLGLTPEPLIDGVIYHHEIIPGADGTTTLHVKGRSISVLLDLEEKNEKYENLPDSMISSLILLRYAQYGIIPQAMQTTDVPLMVNRIPRQHETDLGFLQRLAERNSFVFYIEPLTMGTSIAYFGPEDRLSVPQPALTHNLGPSSNVQTIRFANDALAPAGVSGSFVEPITKMSIKIPALPSPDFPPMTMNPVTPRRRKLMRSTANKNPLQAGVSALAKMAEAQDPIDASGTLDTVSYGHVLRARRLVGVRGAGYAYNGVYKVSKVTHDIKPGAYTQSFELKREGTGALLPVVFP